MAKYQWLAGSTDRTILVYLQDSSSSTGAGLAGIAAADLNCRYIRVETDNDVTIAQLSLSDLTNLTDAHSDGGWKEVDNTNAPGWYRLDLSDAVLAAGAWSAGVSIIDAGANDVAPWAAEIELVAYNSQDSVRLGLTALPNAVPAGNGGLPTVDANNRIVGIQGTINTLDGLDTAQDAQHSTTQTAIGDLPTNAELATALGTADDAVLAQVALVKAQTDLIPGTQDGLTFAQSVLLQQSVLLGKASGLDTTTAVYRSADDGEDRVTATVDEHGNRSAVTLNTA